MIRPFGVQARRALLSAPLLLAIAGCGGDDGSSATNGPPIANYALSGTISHLDTAGLAISNGVETVTVPQGATSFSFTKPLPEGSAYTISIPIQPLGLNCVISNASGTVSRGTIGNISIACNTLISRPLAIGIGASGGPNAAGSRIILPVSRVGTTATTINAVLDTGSTGTQLRASDIFPSTMVTTDGFVFPPGQTSITYNGITVTNVVGTRTFGSQSTDVTVQTGNLGFAQVTFGSGTTATTGVMPVFFIFRTTSNGNIVPTANFANLIGINPDTQPIVVGGVAAGPTTTLCTSQSTVTCGLTSPFRFLSYAPGVDIGFTISKVTLSDCVITTPGSCQLSPNLTLGLTGTTVAGFSTVDLSVPSSYSSSPCRTIMVMGVSQPACSQVVPAVTISSGTASFTGPAIFDSGYPTVRISVPTGASFPDSLPAGSTVRIAAGPGFAYEYATGTGYLATSVVRSTNAKDYSNTGIAFFTQNSLVVDYSRTLEGWRNGSQ